VAATTAIMIAATTGTLAVALVAALRTAPLRCRHASFLAAAVAAALRLPAAAGVNVDVGIGDLTSFYKKAKQRFDADAEFKARAHREVVALQAGDETNRALWLKMIEISQKMYDEGEWWSPPPPPP